MSTLVKIARLCNSECILHECNVCRGTYVTDDDFDDDNNNNNNNNKYARKQGYNWTKTLV